MNMIKFYVVLSNFALVVISSDSGRQESGDVNELSKEAKELYDIIPDENAKNFFVKIHLNQKRKIKEKEAEIVAKNAELGKKDAELVKKDAELGKQDAELGKKDAQICKLNSQTGYFKFECATLVLKSQTEKIFPQFLGYWYKDPKTGQLRNEKQETFMKNIFNEFSCHPNILIGLMRRYSSVERQYAVKSNFQASKKMRTFFRNMYALLTRYDQLDYENCLKNNSYSHAETIIKSIIKPSCTSISSQYLKIIHFCVRYSHIRHSFNFYHYHQMSEISNVTTRLELQKLNKNTIKISPDQTYPPVRIHLCEVLDYMGILQLWNFDENHLQVMNLISSVVQPDRLPIYSPFHCEFKDGKGHIRKVVIPITELEHCPTG